MDVASFNGRTRPLASVVIGVTLALAAWVAACSSGGGASVGSAGEGSSDPFDAGAGAESDSSADAYSTPNVDARAPSLPEAGADVTAPPFVDATTGEPTDATTDSSLGSSLDSSPGATSDASVDAPVADAAPAPPAGLGFDCSASAGGAIDKTSGAPAALACTGLYSSWTNFTIASDVIAYDPGLHLWADGATKQRWIRLPPGTQIDTSNMDEWTFPVGTQIWKEFTLDGVKVETRYLQKLGSSNWVYTTYAWTPDGTRANELTAGATNVNGTSYEIPSLDNCRVCHEGRLDFVLGFEAIGLSSSLATGITMSDLVSKGWITTPPSAPLVVPGDATASAALSWLHANCGNACHNPSNYALAGSTGFFMRLSAAKLSSVQATDTYTTGVNVRSAFKEADGGIPLRIAPGNAAGSCVVIRDGYRDTQGEGIQMPPMDTHVVDTADVQLVTSWINGL